MSMKRRIGVGSWVEVESKKLARIGVWYIRVWVHAPVGNVECLRDEVCAVQVCSTLLYCRIVFGAVKCAFSRR